MCGRLNVIDDPLTRWIARTLGLDYREPSAYNIAPTQTVTVVRHIDGDLALAPMRWWLVPFWASHPKDTKYAMFNARAESAAKSPAFRQPIRKRRCAVPVSGFYEWAKLEGKPKQPYCIRTAEDDGLFLAGVWDRWTDAAGEEVLDSFAIVTTAAVEPMRFVHARQPAMLAPAEVGDWLDPDRTLEDVAPLLKPRLPVALEAVPISSYVSNARNQGPRCVEPVGSPVPIRAP